MGAGGQHWHARASQDRFALRSAIWEVWRGPGGPARVPHCQCISKVPYQHREHTAQSCVAALAAANEIADVSITAHQPFARSVKLMRAFAFAGLALAFLGLTVVHACVAGLGVGVPAPSLPSCSWRVTTSLCPNGVSGQSDETRDPFS